MIGMAKGMVTTLRHVLRPSVTDSYPWGKRELPERSRMSFTMPVNESGVPLCKSCMLCAKSCPVGAITIESEKREDGPGRVLNRFVIDLGLCMYCGICVENCTSAALAHTGDFETATPNRDETYLALYERERASAGVPAEGGSPA
ncbi:MAG: 4Fe-4S binding protein [Coriobacteriales bacterium]|nr:4Fe-4S binding protein [Coriobacteriales bacterium]